MGQSCIQVAPPQHHPARSREWKEGRWPLAEKRKSQTREGAGVCWEAGGGRASSRTAGPSFPDGACENRMRLSPTAVPRRQQHIAAGDSARPRSPGVLDGRRPSAPSEWTQKRAEAATGLLGEGCETGASRRPSARPAAGPQAQPRLLRPPQASRAAPSTWRVDVVISSPGSDSHPAVLFAASVRSRKAEVLDPAQGAQRVHAGRGEGGRWQPEPSLRTSFRSEICVYLLANQPTALFITVKLTFKLQYWISDVCFLFLNQAFQSIGEIFILCLSPLGNLSVFCGSFCGKGIFWPCFGWYCGSNLPITIKSCCVSFIIMIISIS